MTKPLSLIGREVAVLRKKRIGATEGKWEVSDLRVITGQTEKNVQAGGDYFDSTAFNLREGCSPVGSRCLNVRLSFSPTDVAEARKIDKLKQETKAKLDSERKLREAWLNEPRPKLASQIVNRISCQDSEPMIRALSDHLSETELFRMAKALGIEA